MRYHRPLSPALPYCWFTSKLYINFWIKNTYIILWAGRGQVVKLGLATTGCRFNTLLGKFDIKQWWYQIFTWDSRSEILYKVIIVFSERYISLELDKKSNINIYSDRPIIRLHSNNSRLRNHITKTNETSSSGYS